MAAHRTIRIARVEYQPNLQQPVSPVPLGVVVEEILESRRHVIIVGREPGGAVPGLQLEDAWGPFKTIVTEWVQVLARTLREGFDSVTLPDYTIDKVGSRWTGNVYLKTLETTKLALNEDLEAHAMRAYQSHVGEPFDQAPARPSSKLRRKSAADLPLAPWMISRSDLRQASLRIR